MKKLIDIVWDLSPWIVIKLVIAIFLIRCLIHVLICN